MNNKNELEAYIYIHANFNHHCVESTNTVLKSFEFNIKPKGDRF